METNNKVQSQWEYFETRQHRRRRSYAKNIAPASESHSDAANG